MRTLFFFACVPFGLGLTGCENQRTDSDSDGALIHLASRSNAAGHEKSDELVVQPYVDVGERGLALLRMQRYVEAKNVFRQLCKDSPGNATYHAGLAFAYYGIGQDAEMHSALEKSFKLDSQCSLAAVVKAQWLMFIQQDVLAASELLGSAEKNKSIGHFVIYMQGHLQLQEGTKTATKREFLACLSSARKCFDQSIAQKPDFASAFVARSRIALKFLNADDPAVAALIDHISEEERNEELAQAFQDTESAIGLNPSLGEAYYVRALIVQIQSNMEPTICIPYWRAAFEKYPIARPFVVNLVQCLYFPEVHNEPEQVRGIIDSLSNSSRQAKQLAKLKGREMNDMANKGIELYLSLLESGEPLPAELGGAALLRQRIELVRSTTATANRLLEGI